MRKLGDLLLVVVLAGAMVGCGECTQIVSAQAGQLIAYKDGAKNVVLPVAESGDVEIPCDAEEPVVFWP